MNTQRALLLALALPCCGGTPAGSPDAPLSAEDMTPGEKCLAQASAPRDPGDSPPLAIGVSHILVRHADLERPQGATLRREDACLKALEALEALNESGDWDQTVQDYSDSGKSTGGALGRVKRDDLAPGFAEAAFALEVDELSYVVESDRGFHIILRTE